MRKLMRCTMRKICLAWRSDEARIARAWIWMEFVKVSALAFALCTYALVCCFGWNENPYPVYILMLAAFGAFALTLVAASEVPQAEYEFEVAKTIRLMNRTREMCKVGRR